MINIKHIRSCSVSALSLCVLVGCGSDNTSQTAPPSIPEPPPPVNSSPTVSPMDAVSVNELTEVVLNAVAEDSEGDVLSYQWQQTAGSAVELSAADTETLSFVAPGVALADVSETLSFSVSVSDGSNEAVVESVDVTVNALAVEPTLELAHTQVETYGNHTLEIACTAADDDGGNPAISIEQTAGDNINLPESVTCPLAIPLPRPATRSLYSFNVTASDEDGFTVVRELDLAVRPLPKLSDTGVTSCIDNASDSNTASIGLDCLLDEDSDGDVIPAGQDGKTGMSSRYFLLNNDGFQYTKLDADGNVLPDDAEQFACVHDEVTNLLWEVKTQQEGLHASSNTYSWYFDGEAAHGVPGVQNGGVCNHSGCDTSEYIRLVNESGYCGVTNWRLPDLQELITLVHYGKTQPAIDQNYFPQAQSSGYWTSTPSMAILEEINWATVVYFSYGNLGPATTDSANYIRLVTPYEVNGD